MIAVILMLIGLATADTHYKHCKCETRYTNRKFWGTTDQGAGSNWQWCYLKAGGWDWVLKHTIPTMRTANGYKCQHRSFYNSVNFYGCSDINHSVPWCYLQETTVGGHDWEACQWGKRGDNVCEKGRGVRSLAGPAQRSTDEFDYPARDEAEIGPGFTAPASDKVVPNSAEPEDEARLVGAGPNLSANRWAAAAMVLAVVIAAAYTTIRCRKQLAEEEGFEPLAADATA